MNALGRRPLMLTSWYINYSDLRVTQYSAWDLSLQ